MITGHLDWATYTHNQPIRDLDLIVPQLRIKGKALRDKHYETRYLTECGGYLYYDKKLGTRLDCGGQALFNLREYGMSDLSLLSLFSQWRATRLDYSFTIDYGSMQPVKNAIDTNTLEANNKRTRLLYTNGVGRGDTCYVGYLSEWCIRLYDKGKELGLLNQALMRVEQEAKGRYARAFQHESLATGNPAMVARTMIKDRIRFLDCDWYNECMKGELCKYSLEPKPEPALLKWLKRTVKPALRKYAEQYGKQELHKFLIEIANENNL